MAGKKKVTEETSKNEIRFHEDMAKQQEEVEKEIEKKKQEEED